MTGPLHRFFAQDHGRLHALLERATADPRHIELAPFRQFLSGLLKHIGIEEKELANFGEVKVKKYRDGSAIARHIEINVELSRKQWI